MVNQQVPRKPLRRVLLSSFPTLRILTFDVNGVGSLSNLTQDEYDTFYDFYGKNSKNFTDDRRHSDLIRVR